MKLTEILTGENLNPGLAVYLLKLNQEESLTKQTNRLSQLTNKTKQQTRFVYFLKHDHKINKLINKQK